MKKLFLIAGLFISITSFAQLKPPASFVPNGPFSLTHGKYVYGSIVTYTDTLERNAIPSYVRFSNMLAATVTPSKIYRLDSIVGTPNNWVEFATGIYLPLTAGASNSLSGTLYGTNATFSGNLNLFKRGWGEFSIEDNDGTYLSFNNNTNDRWFLFNKRTEVRAAVVADSFKLTNSNDDSLLLAGGGRKALADLSTSNGLSGGNLGSGWRLYHPPSKGIKTLGTLYGISFDSTTLADSIAISVDTTNIETKANSLNKYNILGAINTVQDIAISNHTTLIGEKLNKSDSTYSASNYLTRGTHSKDSAMLKDNINANTTAINSRIRYTDTSTAYGFSSAQRPIKVYDSMGAVKIAPYAISYSSTITLDYSNSCNQTITLTGSSTFSFANFPNGGVMMVYITQDATGGRTVTWPTVKVAGGGGSGTITLSTLAGATDAICIQKIESNYYVNYQTNFN